MTTTHCQQHLKNCLIETVNGPARDTNEENTRPVFIQSFNKTCHKRVRPGSVEGGRLTLLAGESFGMSLCVCVSLFAALFLSLVAFPAHVCVVSPAVRNTET